MSIDACMHLVLCFDDAFAMPAAATIASACRNVRPHGVLLHLVVDGVSADSRAQLTESLPNNVRNAVWIEAHRSTLVGFPNGPPSAAIANATCFIDELLDEDVSRVIYLDTDLMAWSALGELWELDWGSYVLLAARDHDWPTFGAAPGIDPDADSVAWDTRYVCSGVLCRNLASGTHPWRL